MTEQKKCFMHNIMVHLWLSVKIIRISRKMLQITFVYKNEAAYYLLN